MIIGALLLLASLGVILARQPVHAALSFLLTLLLLSLLYLQLSAQFIAVMQVLVYAGAILVIFMFVIVLFQDAHQQIAQHPALASIRFLTFSAIIFLTTLIYLGIHFLSLKPAKETVPEEFGMVQAIGRQLYLDFFFPFEAVVVLFLVAMVGAVYIAKKADPLADSSTMRK